MKDWRAWVLGVVSIWMVIVVIWAFQPMTINVSVGHDSSGAEKTATVECDSPLSGNTAPTGVLPDLPAGESFGSSPCEGVVTTGRTLFFIDVLVTLGVVLLLGFVRRRSARQGHSATLGRSTPVTA